MITFIGVYIVLVALALMFNYGAHVNDRYDR